MDGATRISNSVEDHFASGGSRVDLRRYFAFTLSWNEFIYALAFISLHRTIKPCRSSVLTQLVEGGRVSLGIVDGRCAARLPAGGDTFIPSSSSTMSRR